MDGKSSNVISAAYVTSKNIGLRTFFAGLLLSSVLLNPSEAWAQLGWLNPWKQDTAATAQQTPPDPFSQRRAAAEPQYRTAARTAPAVGGYPNSSPASGGGASAVIGDMPSNQPPPNYGYPQTQSITPTYPTTNYPSTNQPNYQSVPAQSNFNQQVAPRVANLPQQPAAKPEDDLFMPARIVAIVNGDPILAGDVLGPVNQMIDERMASLTPEQRASVSPEEIEQFKEQALKQMLPGLIDVKVVYLDFMRAIPADRLEEMQEMLGKNYDEYQLETDMKNAEVNSPAELDIKLREMGGSLEKKRRQFVEKLVAQQQIQRKVKKDEEVTHQQMLDYYEEHSQDYEKLAKVKWEQVMVKFSSYPNRQATWEAMASMGNQVLRGAPLNAVAKRESQGIKASSGGQYDWTRKGSLKNETIDKAIFSLPIGELSPIIESPEGFHIVRVLEREDAGMVPFTEAQVEIKEKIKNERRQGQMEAYILEVKGKAQVWTIFDEAK
ncbi:peptidylprolyl isomerase [Bremerella alba]|uniref:Chaperone SurA n=1 Tax=Bremerella alba TaxID=980252 RepID=A0A7V9A9P6_9BACT|nr:peptidylprolyl isomerase [Bremerella alba]MBA2117652.1 Chaperone SurA [Bremerella alba]